VMYAKTRHLQYLINDLHTLALADAGELPLNRRPVAPKLLLEHSALTHVMEAQEKGVAITVDAQPTLPEINVDTGRMSQVLGNLISNALRYTPRGGGIRLTAERYDGSLLIRVRDNGPGIAAEHLPYIFDRFYRADKSRAQSRPNENESGLGLAIARSIVEAHGGTIAVASRNGDGALFAITLPLS
jgi:signal transduction histidine kinase